MWGQADPEQYQYLLQGIIPTRVGTSFFGSVDFFKCQDHPHACGDKLVLVAEVFVI